MCTKFIILLFSLPSPFNFFGGGQRPSTSSTYEQSHFSRVFIVKLNAASSQWLVVKKKWQTAKPELERHHGTAPVEVLLAQFNESFQALQENCARCWGRRRRKKSQILWIWKSSSSQNNCTHVYMISDWDTNIPAQANKMMWGLMSKDDQLTMWHITYLGQKG